jgi:3-dehydro-L-gulonate 2-dehydrogenase
MILSKQTLEDKFGEILQKYGFPQNQALTIAQVFTESTLDGVFSHGINRFPRFIDDIKEARIKPGVFPEQKNAFNALEQWDGHQGAGISNALFCTDRCIELASAHGIGCVGLRNTNHWMRGGSYGLRAAEKGFLFLGWTNTMPNMPPWGASETRLGNNPFVMAIPRKEGHLLLDMSMSQYSYGKLEWHRLTGTDLPEYGGYSQDQKLTKDPGEILESKQLLPAGLWKGSALALVLDLAAAILSCGNTTEKIGKLSAETDLSQVFIVVDIDRHMSSGQRTHLVEETLAYMTAQDKNVRYPGQRSNMDRLKHLENGVDVPEKLWNQILNL